MATFSVVCSHLSYKNRYYMQNQELPHDQDECGPKTSLSITERAESLVTVSGDLIEYSGSVIVNKSITPVSVMAAIDGKMIRNLTRATDFFC